jgi:hypothetical protein
MMKTFVTSLFLMLAMVAVAEDMLTNESVLKLVKSGLGDDLIVGIVQNQPGKYSLTPDEMVRLKQAGVSEKILTAMATKSTAAPANSSKVVKIDMKTPVLLSVSETTSSKTAKAGEALKFIVTEDVAVGGHVVIAKGATGAGRIITAEKKSFATRNGKLEVAVDSVQAADGHNIPLDGHLSVGGGGVGFGRTGKDAEIVKGQVINAVVTAPAEVTF